MNTVAGASSMLEASRDLTLDAVQAAAARTFGSNPPKELSVSQIKKLLDSKFDREIHDGLRKSVDMMYRSQDCLPLFSAVIKNVASPNVEIKKLVYIYLVRYAEQEPDLALLSINTIQKSLSDQDPRVRAMALRVMSSINVTIISQIVSLAIKKGCADMSAVVRKTAALAIPKCHRLDPTTEPQLLECLSQLLGDRQYFVVGSAVAAFLQVCPQRMELLHKHYRALVKKLVDMDEWGQLALVKLLTVYARRCLPRPSRTDTGKKAESESSGKTESSHTGRTSKIDPDLAIFLDACKSLLKNRNPAVIMAVMSAFVYVGTDEYVEQAVPSLVALLRGPEEMHAVVLHNITSICIDYPALFAPYLDHFWVWSSDGPTARRLKLEIIALVFPECDTPTKGLILSELEHLMLTAAASDPELVRDSVAAIGRCAQNDASTVSWCMGLLLRQAAAAGETPYDGDDDSGGGNLVVSEALAVVRRLIQQDPARHQDTIVWLARNLDTILDAGARATVVWLIGEFDDSEDRHGGIAPDVLRLLVRSFADEESAVKAQIMLLAAKVCLRHRNRIAASSKESDNGGGSTAGESTATNTESTNEGGSDDRINAKATDAPAGASSPPRANGAGEARDLLHPIELLWEYVQLLVRYDASYELRDRMRVYRNLLAEPDTLQLANLLLLAPKPVPPAAGPSAAAKNLLLGSASLAIAGQASSSNPPPLLPGYERLPDWVSPEDMPDPRLRHVEGSSAADTNKGSRPSTAAAMLDSATTAADGSQQAGPVAAPKPRAPVKSLDDWLDEEDEQVQVRRPIVGHGQADRRVGGDGGGGHSEEESDDSEDSEETDDSEEGDSEDEDE